MVESKIFILSKKVFSGFDKYAELKAHLINGECEKHPLLTTTYLCGQYAYYTATSIDQVNLRTFKAELKFLKEMGIPFDFEGAISCAKHLLKMLDNENAKLVFY